MGGWAPLPPKDLLNTQNSLAQTDNLDLREARHCEILGAPELMSHY